MGISNMLGADGIFVCDNCKGRLVISLGDEVFEALKDEINKGDGSTHKCFLCSMIVHSNDGLYVPPLLMADSIEKQLEKQDEMYKLFKDGTVHCPDCGTQLLIKEKLVKCECGTAINTKKYGKNLKIPALKKVTFKQYIKFLRGKSSVPGRSSLKDSNEDIKGVQ